MWQQLSQFPVTIANTTVRFTGILFDLLTPRLFDKNVSSPKVLYQKKKR